MATQLEKDFFAIAPSFELPALPADVIYPLIDLTCLDQLASHHTIDDLVQKARHNRVAAICVFPQHLSWISKLEGTQRATVVNFPGGDQPSEQVLHDIEWSIVQQQADEIDYVFAYSLYLAGQTTEALGRCRAAAQLCRQHGRIFKVILETGALPSMDLIYQISAAVIEVGCDMLKTSTGKISTGASLSAAYAMLSAIKDSKQACGIKISGGIKTGAQASHYINMAEHLLHKPVNKSWFRIGASTMPLINTGSN